jgi:hypothetical protein
MAADTEVQGELVNIPPFALSEPTTLDLLVRKRGENVRCRRRIPALNAEGAVDHRVLVCRCEYQIFS